VIGQYGGPAGAAGFEIGFHPGNYEMDDLTIGGGRYYVDGILCDATRPQPGEAVPADGIPLGERQESATASGATGAWPGRAAFPLPPRG
jgi:hypothetical protein